MTREITFVSTNAMTVTQLAHRFKVARTFRRNEVCQSPCYLYHQVEKSTPVQCSSKQINACIQKNYVLGQTFEYRIGTAAITQITMTFIQALYTTITPRSVGLRHLRRTRCPRHDTRKPDCPRRWSSRHRPRPDPSGDEEQRQHPRPLGQRPYGLTCCG
jgi:hypothetical protein